MDLKLSLRQTVDATVGALFSADVRRIALIDTPTHANVGDQAILLGEYAFLRRYTPDARIDFFDVANYSSRCEPLIEQADVILYHGGGNFGDLWPRHHELRKRIFERFRHKRIIQLPQSMSFTDPTELAETARLINACEALTLCLRDEESLAKAQANFDCEIVLCPDMAFGMDAIHRKYSKVDCFALLRTDKEVAVDHTDIVSRLTASGMSFLADDWLVEPNSTVKRADDLAGRLTKRFPRLLDTAGSVASGLRIAYARASLDRGIAMLSQGDIVLSDRLHAHVICCLLGIPNVVMDSLDGKVSALHSAWTHRFGYARLAKPSDVIENLREVSR